MPDDLYDEHALGHISALARECATKGLTLHFFASRPWRIRISRMGWDPERCACGHLMRSHDEWLDHCRVPGCDCPAWCEKFSDAHLRRTPKVAIDLHGPRILSPEKDTNE